MHGARRVITFCCLTAVVPTLLIILPLYLRHSVYSDVTYALAESDVVEIKDGISSIFCQRHTLAMNSTAFNAYQISGEPALSKRRKHIRLKKSIQLPDDTLEYWGFYLLNGSTVSLKVCSRYEGSRILVVEGGRNLRTCGMLEHRKDSYGRHFADGHKTVKVIFESHAQEIVDANTAKESTQIDKLEKVADDILQKHLHPTNYRKRKHMLAMEPNRVQEPPHSMKRRKHKRRHSHRERMEQLSEELNEHDLQKRSVTLNSAIVLDGGVEHGGNAPNYTETSFDEESSVSSFENGLLKCYDGQILLSKEFAPARNCNDIHYLDTGSPMETQHNITYNGYYYYIFYSDNDFVSNDIHAVFDIYKPSYKYANLSESKECKNSTNCKFDIPFWSNERVIVEVPTRDGIEHEEDDITLLVSTCEPRVGVYMIFPVVVLFLILVCAFL